MRKLTVIFLASISVGAAAACGSSSDSGTPDGGQDDASSSSSGSGGGSSGGSGSSSGGGVSEAPDASLPMAMQIGTAPTPIDGGVYCPGTFGSMAACAAPEVCCWGDQTQVPAPLAGCTSASACSGSSIACSSTDQCSAGQVCCFAYQSDAGAVAAMTAPFVAQCASSCPTGDMIHYQLCGSSSDCAAGEICNNMAPYAPYCISNGSLDGGGGDGGDAASTSAADAASTLDAADAGAE
jgi:hypothetical protein